MIALATTRTGLFVAVAATDPVRQADLAARVALAGHTVAEEIAEADIVLADPDAAIRPDQPVLRMGDGGALPLALSPAQLSAALQAVAVGLRVSLPSDSFAEPEPIRSALTPRELEILACLGEGLSNKAAARRLGISAHTVKFHLEAVFAKLGATSRTDAVARGLRGGLILL